jgi:hypothetical protein
MRHQRPDQINLLVMADVDDKGLPWQGTRNKEPQEDESGISPRCSGNVQDEKRQVPWTELGERWLPIYPYAGRNSN